MLERASMPAPRSTQELHPPQHLRATARSPLPTAEATGATWLGLSFVAEAPVARRAKR